MLKKLLQQTAIPHEILGETKIIWLPDKVTIENYKKLNFISTESIESKYYKIIGQDLKIAFMDQYLLTIVGKITKIEKAEE